MIMKNKFAWTAFRCGLMGCLWIGTMMTASAEENSRAANASMAPQALPEIVRGIGSNGRLDSSDYDFTEMRRWGANMVRIQVLPMHEARRLGKSLWDAWPAILDQLEDQVKKARDADLKVVVALMQFPAVDGPRHGTAEFWNDPKTSQILCKVWRDMASRLRPYDEVIWGYDLFNEPLDRAQLPHSPKQWRPMAIKIVEEIRKIDSNVWIICETGPGFYFTGFQDFQPLPDSKIIYSAHFYEPDTLTHQGILTKEIGNGYPSERIEHRPWLPDYQKKVTWNRERLAREMQPAVDFQKKYKVPIWVGEFSVVRWAPEPDAVQWLKDVISLFEERGFSWSYHAFRENNAWSLEHDNAFWKDGKPQRAQPVAYETERAKVIKAALQKNAAGKNSPDLK